jgi:membrane associated rhomboid family serine protease
MNFLRKPFRYRNDNIVYVLIGLNIAVFFAARFLDLPLVYFFSMVPGLVAGRGWIWQFATYMFIHGSLSHLLFNMFALFVFGLQVERRMGSREFLLFYMATGILAGFFSFIVYALSGNWRIFLMGASGAIFAVQLAYASLFPEAVIYIWGILPLRAPVMVLVFTALEIFSLITGMGGNVAHFTHLAGFAFGWIYFLARFGINPWDSLTRR